MGLQARQDGEGLHGFEGDGVRNHVTLRAQSGRQLDVLDLPRPRHLEEEVVVEDELLHGADEAVEFVELVVVLKHVADVHAPEVKLRCTPGYLGCGEEPKEITCRQCGVVSMRNTIFTQKVHGYILRLLLGIQSLKLILY